jgi:transcriptional regulator with XRE-family HTH domain
LLIKVGSKWADEGSGRHGVKTNEFGQKVRDRRLEEGLSQEKLAQLVGISRNYLSQIERGQATNLSWQVMERLTSLLGLKGEPIGGENEMANLPVSLAEFAKSAGLPPDDVLMLARLRYRGQQPTTPEKWELLYNVIKMTVGK